MSAVSYGFYSPYFILTCKYVRLRKLYDDDYPEHEIIRELDNLNSVNAFNRFEDDKVASFQNITISGS